MKKIIILFILSFNYSISQTITVDDTGNTPTSLVNNLIGNSCIEISNTSVSSTQSVALFDNNGSSFPISNGIIIRNGIANLTQGTYTGNNLDSQVNTNSDPNLQALVNAQGQTGNITDVAFLEFDFIPLSNNFSFNFLFASNEYGQWQCASFDTFAFLLTDLTTNTTTNLAVIPGTSTPVSVLNIRDNLYNSGCASAYPNLFGVYNVLNPSGSTLNMRGHTNMMTAFANVIPNNSYRIRIAIGDYLDHRYDSAVFLQSGSFVTTIDLGIDRTICEGDVQNLTTGLDETLYVHNWTRNGLALPETGNTISISEEGTYMITVTKPGSSCVITDTIVINELIVNPPVNLLDCYTTAGANHSYNLTINNETLLNINDTNYNLSYYNSISNANNNIEIPQSQINNYISIGNETIYIKILNTQNNTYCDAIYPFDLLINEEINVVSPTDLIECSTPVSTALNLLNHFLLQNSINTDDYLINFYTNAQDAQDGTGNFIPNPEVYLIPTSTTTTTTGTVWVRIQDINTFYCFSVISFNIIIHPLPLIDSLGNVIECFEYTLPAITNGNYFTGPNGTGDPLFAGDIINENSSYFIFTGPDANGCTNQSSFNAFFADDFEIDVNHCGQFYVPTMLLGSFYTATGGPTGSGTLIPAGTQITSNQSIFYYVVDANGAFCLEKEFPLIINPLPPVDELDDVITCNSYVLPSLQNGNYYNSESALIPYNTTITESQTLTIISGPDANNCYNNSSFSITIINNLTAQNECGSFMLPDLPNVANYYTLPGGPNTAGNTIVPELTEITTPGTYIYYIYAPTSIAPNCTENYSFQVNIYPEPAIDTIEDQTVCGSFPLPTLTNGTYYLLSGGPTVENQVSFSAGQTIDLTGINLNPGTYYIYVPANEFDCPNEDSFTINVNPFPIVPQVSDFASCQPYSIPTPTIGNYYTEINGPNGTGSIVNASDVFAETKSFYLYYQDPVTLCEVDRPFTVYFNTIGLPTFNPIDECGSYTLPNLTFQPPFPNEYQINYYSQSGGNVADLIDPSNYTFSTPGTYTVYVFASNGDRFFACTEERSFTITISETPVLPTFSNIVRCGSYTLPVLDNSLYTVNYYAQSNGVGLINASQYTYSTPGTYDVYVYATATNNTTCFDEKYFTITIYPLLDLQIEDEILCVDPITEQPVSMVTLNSNLNTNLFQVNWYLNNNLVHTGSSYTTDQPGIYTIETIKLTPEVGNNCNYNATTAQVFTSSAAIGFLTQSSDFNDTSNIIVTITDGIGQYEYALDNGNFQESPQFNNVSSGEHSIIVRDVYGNCDALVLQTIVLKYPKYFTPNGDGIHETWNIWDMRTDFPDALITIFDRYGKLIKQFKPSSFGWDGTLNGYALPATDYWFTVDYTSNGLTKQFKNHFSLKR